MSELGVEVVSAARQRIGTEFIHHFKPENLCAFGEITVGACMQRGLGPTRYDCSGLVVASFCEVLGISTDDWPADLRHAKQMEALAEEGETEPGDILLFYTTNNQGRPHIGIYTSPNTVIHANGISRVVDEGSVTGSMLDIKRIASSALVSV